MRLTSFLLIAMLVPGCERKDSHERAASDLVADISKLNDILDGVTDERSADSAAPKIEAVARDMEAIADRLKALPDESKEENEAIKKSIRPKLDAENNRSNTIRQRLEGNRAVMIKLQPSMMLVDSAMMKVGFAAIGGGKPFRPPSADQPLARSMPIQERIEMMKKQYGDAVTIKLEMPPGTKGPEIYGKLEKMAGAKSYAAQGGGTRATLTLAPVADMQALATKIAAMGKVSEMDLANRTLTVVVEAAPATQP